MNRDQYAFTSGSAAQYDYRARIYKAWQKVSPTRMRQKIVERWSRRYVGIPSPQVAEAILQAELASFSTINEGEIFQDAGPMWGCELEYTESRWVEPPVYKLITEEDDEETL